MGGILQGEPEKKGTQKMFQLSIFQMFVNDNFETTFNPEQLDNFPRREKLTFTTSKVSPN